MSKYITYVDLNDIEKLEIYQAKGSYTAAQLRTRLGCDYIINGGLYTMSTMKPNCKLKVNGTVVVSDNYNYYGPSWNNPPTDLAHRILPPDLASIAYDNAIACFAMKNNGVKSDMVVNGADANTAIGYSTSRTAMGMKDGKLALYIGSDSMKPSALYNYLDRQGWSDILMLDGGGSTQGYLGAGKQVTSSRKVHNYICVYLKKSNSGSTGGSSSGSSSTGSTDFTKPNPYTKPTRAIQYGMTGNDVKWVQYQLNVHEVACDVDGSFGPAMLAAVKEFQKSHGLAVDGSAGPDTRTCLAKSHPDGCMGEYTLANNPYKAPTRAIQYGMKGDDVRWAQYQLCAAGYIVAIDGSFGPDMLSHVKEFQADHNLAVDGSCGPATQAELKKF